MNFIFNCCIVNYCVLLLNIFDYAFGHGMMMDPINRASLWRIDPTAPKDYDDNQGFCGGQSVQWNINGGNCGFCGDDYRNPVPRAHENTGTYGQGKIVANYTRGQIVPISILITTNHRGWFQFSVCPLETKTTLETEECFHNVTLSDGRDIYKLPSIESGLYQMEVQLPKELICEQCVFRWHYNAGNTWGDCGNGTFATGCGPQETFRSCADVSIL